MLHLVRCSILQVYEDGKGSEEEVEAEVREMLAEMGHSMFLPAVRSIVLILRPFIRTALRGIFVSTAGLEKASASKNLMRFAQNPSFQRCLLAGCCGVHL